MSPPGERLETGLATTSSYLPPARCGLARQLPSHAHARTSSRLAHAPVQGPRFRGPACMRRLRRARLQVWVVPGVRCDERVDLIDRVPQLVVRVCGGQLQLHDQPVHLRQRWLLRVPRPGRHFRCSAASWSQCCGGGGLELHEQHQTANEQPPVCLQQEACRPPLPLLDLHGRQASGSPRPCPADVGQPPALLSRQIRCPAAGAAWTTSSRALVPPAALVQAGATGRLRQQRALVMSRQMGRPSARAALTALSVETMQPSAASTHSSRPSARRSAAATSSLKLMWPAAGGRSSGCGRGALLGSLHGCGVVACSSGQRVQHMFAA